MSIRTSPWPVGVPCWADLMVPDVPAASAFYGSVLGWTVPEPEEEQGGYVVAQVGGAAVAGIGPEQPGAPTAWTLYLATDDADATAAAAAQHGGTVLLPPGDVGPLGRMGIVADPSGAVFGLWQAGTVIGAELVDEPGGVVWEDLRSTDPAAAKSFYGAVFGYRFEPVERAGADYDTFSLADGRAPLGGMGGLMGLPEGTPSHWLVSFAVADMEAAVRAAQSGGGRVLTPPKDTPYGRLAALVDPYGAAFVVLQLARTLPQPDRAG